MSSKNNAASRLNKNCLVAFRNKKLNNFDGENSLINAASALGYYFDKISYVALSTADRITKICLFTAPSVWRVCSKTSLSRCIPRNSASWAF